MERKRASRNTTTSLSMAEKSGDGDVPRAVAPASSGSSLLQASSNATVLKTATEQDAKVQGFKINFISMRDAETGNVMWTSASQWKNAFDDGNEVKVELPSSILKCNAVSREMGFSSQQEMKDFRLVQDVYLHGNAIEEWRFQFGFVIPLSTNTWQCTIQSAGEDNMIPVEVLSGNLTIVTSFYDGNELICKNICRIYYV